MEWIAKYDFTINEKKESILTSDSDKLEERTAEILGQIQASVAEYVRTMNEAGALRRREADEAHRQQDDAIRALKAIQLHAAATFEAHSKLAARAGSEWLGLVERGLRESAVAQAEAAARTSVARIEMRLNQLNSGICDALSMVGQLADRNERICRALAWKTVAASAGWLTAVTVCLRLFVL